jgi:hypothetical protein
MRSRQMTERFLWTIALGAVALLPAAAVAQTPSGSNVHPKGLHCLSRGSSLPFRFAGRCEGNDRTGHHSRAREPSIVSMSGSRT